MREIIVIVYDSRALLVNATVTFAVVSLTGRDVVITTISLLVPGAFL